MKLFANKQFTVGTVTTATLFLGLSGLTFSLPIFYQAVRKIDAFHTGLGLLPMSLSLLIAAPLSAALSRSIRPKLLVHAGLIFTVLSLLVLYWTLTVTSTVWTLAPGLILYGLGIGIIMSQLSNITLSAVPIYQAGEASGVNNTFRQLGQTLGSALIGAVLLSTLTSGMQAGVTKSTVIPEQAKAQISNTLSKQTSQVEFSGGAQFTTSVSPAIKDEIVSISNQATVNGTKVGFLYGALFAFLGLLLSFALPNFNPHEHEEVSIPTAGH
jgi:predicted MFS family arabinose efflux permease